MGEEAVKKVGFRQKFVHGMKEYLVNFIFLSFFFSVFTWYRRLILAEHNISYFNYGVSLIEAAVLAKIILIGDALRIGRGFANKPLIIPTLHRTVIFSILVGAFKIIEHVIRGLIGGLGFVGSFEALFRMNKYSLIAECIVVFFAFIPFFAIKELERVLGEGRIGELFFKKRIAPQN